MAWNMNGFIAPEVIHHVKEVTVDKTHYHIITKNKRRVSVPRVSFFAKTLEQLEALYIQVNQAIHQQANINIEIFKNGKRT